MLAMACDAASALAGAVQGKVLGSPYVFTDERAILRLAEPADEVSCTIKTLSARGWGPTRRQTLAASEGRLEVKPLTEGIHIVTVEGPKPVEYRFLAMAPPPAADIAPVVAALPRTGRKLLTGEKYTIVVMSESGTEAATYEAILGLLLQRATGNRNITFFDRSYYERSVDATVRRFREDVLPQKPDLGLVMYGSADQRHHAPLAGYLEQYQFLAEHLAEECGADTVFMQPIPDIDVPVGPAAGTPASHPPQFAFRAIGHADALRPLAAELKVSLADTFGAVWGRGGKTLEDSVRAMWAVYPPATDQPMRSLLESDGKGETLHTNALGCLAIARAVLEAITGTKPSPILTFSGYSEWTGDGVVSHVTMRNVSGVRRMGRLEVYPLPDDTIAAPSPVPYNISSDETVSFDVTWPKITTGEDLLAYPADRYVAPGTPRMAIVDFCGDQSRVYAPAFPFAPTFTILRGRQVCAGNEATVRTQHGKESAERQVPIPRDQPVGRIRLVEKATERGDTLWAAAELAFVRYGLASRGEAVVDGKLDEWADSDWIPVGEACQARSAKGPEDHRQTKDECYLKWAFRAGRNGLFLAVDATGQLDKDQFTLFFDPREPKRLGTVGRYYWVSGQLTRFGKIRLQRGETSPLGAALEGCWKSEENRTTAEILVPYALMEARAWPASGDLGLSIWWAHTGADGKVTDLFWSDDGYPWTPRWFGVVRLSDRPATSLPVMIRIK